MTTRQHFSRRDLLKLGAAGAAVTSLAACATMGGSKGKVVVIGGGYGGATAAKYTRLWSDGSIDVTLVEPEAAFVSCPLSNLVLGGSRTLADLTVPYTGLAKYGVRVMRDTATAVDPAKKQVRLASGTTLDYDRLVRVPGSRVPVGQRRGHVARRQPSRFRTHGKQDRRRRCCAASSRRCPTAAWSS